jgi:hypothetical protein
VSDGGTRGIAFLFALLAALLFVVAGVVDFVGAFVFLAFGAGGHAFGAWYRSVVFVVVGVLVGAFAIFGHSGDRERTLAAGVILVVLAVLGWLVLGFGGDLLAVLGALFSLIAGILYLVASQ